MKLSVSPAVLSAAVAGMICGILCMVGIQRTGDEATTMLYSVVPYTQSQKTENLATSAVASMGVRQAIAESDKLPEPPESGMVWVSEHGMRFHSHKECSNMVKPSQISVQSAKRKGLDPCKKCYNVK